MEFITPGPVSGRIYGSIVLSYRRVFIGVGSRRPGRISKVVLEDLENVVAEGEAPKDVIDRAFRLLFKMAPNVEFVTVSSFGPFLAIGLEKRQDDKNYGLIADATNYADWAYFNVYRASKDAARKYAKAAKNNAFKTARTSVVSDPDIIVSADVNVAALGEHFWFNEAVEDDKNQDLQSRIQFATAYVKISQSVNAGLCTDGWVVKGRHQPVMSVFKPRKNFPAVIDNELSTNLEFIDEYPGACEVHGDCIEGLVSAVALVDRAKVDHFEQISPDDALWDVTAYYIAELCLNITTMVSPRRISLGGRVLRGPHIEENGWQELIEAVRYYFEIGLEGERRGKKTPYYAELDDLDTYISYRSCEYPGVYGGIIVANWLDEKRKPLDIRGVRVQRSHSGF